MDGGEKKQWHYYYTAWSFFGYIIHIHLYCTNNYLHYEKKSLIHVIYKKYFARTRARCRIRLLPRYYITYITKK